MNRILALGLVVLAGLPAVSAAQDAPPPPLTTDERLNATEGEIRALWRSYFGVVRDNLPNTKGSLDCSSEAYEEVKATNSFLVFFAACEKIEPYLNGYRATLLIGNPHAFSFTRLTGTLSYGENVAAALVREKQRVPFSAATELRPGAWVQVYVPIAAAEKDVSKIIVELEVTGALGRRSDPPVRSTSAPQNGAENPR